MKVLHLSYHCCVRVIKEATLVQNSGLADCYFMQHRLSHSGFLNTAPWLSFWPEDDDGVMLRNKLAGLRQYGIDMVHVHNEPSWLVPAVKKVIPDMPVIFDAHDLQLVHGEDEGADDITALSMADGFIFTSQSMADCAIKHVPRVAKKPHTIVYSKVLPQAFPSLNSLERIGGIVYQGGLWDSRLQTDRPYEFRDWREAFKKMTGMGLDVNVFPASDDDVVASYKKTGATIYKSLDYYNLLANMNRFDWSLVGSPIDHIMIQTCMPNKLFESIAAGVPVIVLNAAEVAEFVKEHKVGVVIDSIEQIPEIYSQHEKYRSIVEQKRDQLANMLTELPAIEGIYRSTWTIHNSRKKK